MPTNEERREVAARLRKKYGERQGTFEPQSISIQAMNRMDDLLDCLPKRRDMFLDLADLIEPEPERTCRAVSHKNAWLETRDKFCSECDALLYDGCGDPFYSMPLETQKYCFNCGAKVVSE